MNPLLHSVIAKHRVDTGSENLGAGMVLKIILRGLVEETESHILI